MAPIPKADIKDLVEWQKHIDDNVNIATLSLPGTHNSAACHLSFPSVQCQGASITEQLEHGVRFFDIRCATPFYTGCGLGSSPTDLQVIHGNFPVKIPLPVKLNDVLNDVYKFLEKHKSEVVIVSLKPEGAKKWEGDEFADLLWDKYLHNCQDRWFLENKIPKLGEARGKAVLFRRFGVKDGERKKKYGIDAAWWKYNCQEDDRGHIVVQDFCEVMEPQHINQKVNYINEHIKRAQEYNATGNANDNAKMYINFCSGSNFWNPKCWPKNVAKGVANGCEKNVTKGCGVIIIDYAEQDQWSFVRSLVQLNLERN